MTVCMYSAGITGDVVMDADADRVTPYVFWQLSPDDDHYIDVLKVSTMNSLGEVSDSDLRKMISVKLCDPSTDCNSAGESRGQWHLFGSRGHD